MNDVIIGLLLLVSMVSALVGLIMLIFFQGRRKRGGLIFSGSFCAFVAVAVFGMSHDNSAAIEAGFESYSDYSQAQRAGITDPEVWRVERERLAEIERETQQQREAERLAQAEAERAAEEAEEADNRRRGFHCLSSWDGSHRSFRNEVRDLMRDPDSFEHIDTRVTPVDENGMHQVVMRYRARNGFGGMNIGTAVGTYSNSSCSHLVLSVE
jgi:hypothetical protein